MQTPITQLIERLEARKQVLSDRLENNQELEITASMLNGSINALNFAITQAKELLEAERASYISFGSELLSDFSEDSPGLQYSEFATKQFNEQFKNYLDESTRLCN